MESDLSLIDKVKKNNDSQCLTELINRHSGVYQYVIDKFAKSPSSVLDKSLFIDDKNYVIYESVLEYDPNRNSKFSTFLANKAKWKCLTALNKHKKFKSVSIDNPESSCKNSKELNESKRLLNNSGSPLEFISNMEIFDFFYDMLNKENDKRLEKIIDIRYNTYTNKLAPWRESAEKLGLSIQWVIVIHNRFIKKVKQQLEKDYV